MRLTQIAQALSGNPISEPWLEGVVRMLELLSYKAVHEWLEFITRRDISWAQSLSKSALAATETDLFVSLEQEEELVDMWKEFDKFLNRPQSNLTFLAGGLQHSLGSWLKAVEQSGQLNRPSQDLLDIISVCEDKASELVSELESARTSFRFRKIVPLSAAMVRIEKLQRDVQTLLYEQSASPVATLRMEVESLLCPVYDLAGPFARRVVVRELATDIFTVVASGSFFDYCDEVERQKSAGARPPRWSVLLAPPGLVEAILRDVIIENTRKHVLTRLSTKSKIDVIVEIEGLDALDHRIRFRISVAVNNNPWHVPTDIWHRTLGRNRTILLKVHGGNVKVETSESKMDNVVVEFLSGHF